MTELFSRRLAERARTAGAQPLITYYDERSHARTELSGASFVNWVDKTAGLLTDEILIEPGQAVRLDLLQSAPGHWMTLVWAAAAWRVRCPITLDEDPADAEIAVEVVGPAHAQRAAGATERVAVSLHPLGLGFDTPLPAGVIDYGLEVRSQPDSFSGPWPFATDPVRIGEQVLTQADLAAAVTAGPSARQLIIPRAVDPWSTLINSLVVPVLTGGSVVVVIGAGIDRQNQIAVAERVTG